ncbi:hypothetical protein HDF11_001422 [Tunturiibacter psychrotolerans]
MQAIAFVLIAIFTLGVIWILVCEFRIKRQIGKKNFPQPQTLMGTIYRKKNFLAIHELLFPQSELRWQYKLANKIVMCSMVALLVTTLFIHYHQR